LASTCTADRGYAPRIFVDHQALLSNFPRLDGVIVSLARAPIDVVEDCIRAGVGVLVRSHSGSTLILLNELPNSALTQGSPVMRSYDHLDFLPGSRAPAICGLGCSVGTCRSTRCRHVGMTGPVSPAKMAIQRNEFWRKEFGSPTGKTSTPARHRHRLSAVALRRGAGRWRTH
jgi:hypothetical protein